MMFERRSMWLPVASLVAASAITGAVLVANDSARAVVRTSVPGVWLANDGAASVSHVGQDGVDATVGLEHQDGALHVVEVDGVAYVADDGGRVSRIDPAQLAVSQETLLPSSGTRLVGGAGRLYAVDAAAGTVRQLDPVQLTAIGAAVSVGRTLGSVVVDTHGVLWAHDVTAGDVLPIDGRTLGRARKVADGGVAVQLAVVGEAVVAVDPARAVATVVTGADANEARPLATPPGTELSVPESVADGTVLPIVTANRSLVLLDVGTGRVRSVDLGPVGHSMGAPRVSSGKAYVPDYTDGSVIVVDIASATATATVAVTGKPGRFDLLADDTSVYVNDPRSERAWVIDRTGRATPAAKYDPASPRTGGRPVAVAPPPPTIPAPTPPTTPPTTAPSGDDRPDDRPDRDRATTTTTRAPLIILPPTTAPENQRPDEGRHRGDRTTTSAPGAPGNAVPRRRDETTTTASGEAGAPATPAPGGNGADGGTTTTTAPGDGAVRNVVAVSGDGTASVSWTAPARWNRVNGYTVTVEPGGSPVRLGAGQTSYRADNLRNGTEYSFVVTAESAGGPGAPVRSNVVIPAGDVPGAPTLVSVQPGDAQVTVSWQAPTGKATLAGYALDVVPTGGGTAISRSLTAAQTSISVGGLANGTEYRVSLRATVAGGASGPAATSAPFVPRGRPGAPGSVIAAVTGAGQVRVSWVAPPTSGSPITGYEVSAAGVPTLPVAAGRTTADVTGLTVGSSYTFSVRALSAAGTSDPGVAPAVVIESQVPGAPGSVAARGVQGGVTVTWTAAAGNGTTVASYVVRNLADGTSRTAAADATTLLYDGLTLGATYTFDVRAVGANGAQGITAATGSAVPFGPPAAPTGLAATATSATAATVTFTAAASSNGTSVTQWRVTTTPDTGVRTVTAGTASLTGLVAGTTYTVNVVAVGTNGLTSPPGSVGVTTLAGLPPAPTNFKVTAGLANRTTGTVRVSFSWDPVPGAMSYRLDTGRGGAPIVVTATTYAYTGRGDDSDHTATVTAITPTGESPAATHVYFLPFYENCGVNGKLCP